TIAESWPRVARSHRCFSAPGHYQLIKFETKSVKNTFIALAAFGTMVSASYAQSTVTLYGVLDANLGSFQTNGVAGVTAATPNGTSVQNLRQTKIDSAGLSGNRWGLRVSEDLGGGMSA